MRHITFTANGRRSARKMLFPVDGAIVIFFTLGDDGDYTYHMSCGVETREFKSLEDVPDFTFNH